MLFEPRHKTVK